MKITAIELYDISIPFIKPYKLSKVYGTLTHADAIILKIHTDVGIVGLGEADPKHPFTEDTPESIITAMQDHIVPHLLGKDPTRIARIEAHLDQVVEGNLMARGAVNMALYDILGKVHQLPAHAFLGGLIHDRLPLLGPIGSGTPGDDAAAIDKLIGEGYRTVMIKMGALPIEQEIKRMLAAAGKYGHRITFIADANQGWELREAMQFVEGIRGSEPTLLEQPIGRTDIKGLKQICDHVSCLLSADESVVTLQEAGLLMQAEAVNVFSIKVSKNGGLSKSKMIANSAEVFGIQCLMNSMLEFGITQAASLQLGCTLNNLMDCGHAYMSVLRMSDDITDFEKYISNAVVTVPEAPGLGVTVDDAKLERYTKNHLKF
jgi:L-alanine-DL-glutamate epimerase-like enolase superfamily enzyme